MKSDIKFSWLMFPTFLLTAFNTLFSWVFADEIIRNVIKEGFLQVLIGAMNESIFVIAFTYVLFIFLIFGWLALVSRISTSKKVYTNVAIWTLIELIGFVPVKSVLLWYTSPQSIWFKFFIIAIMLSVGFTLGTVLYSMTKDCNLKTWQSIANNMVNCPRSYNFGVASTCFLMCVATAIVGIILTGVPLLDWLSKISLL